MALRIRKPDGMSIEHGGAIDKARAAFPDAALPWIDLSTGINPHSYPFLRLPTNALSRLPETTGLNDLLSAAATAYGCKGADHIAAAPGTQALLPLVARLVDPGNARILGPTYAEHGRCARLAGHDVSEVSHLEALGEADLAIVVNPNNPDGRLWKREQLLQLARTLRQRDGLLVVDEAFMDVAPTNESLAADADVGNIVVLRSFGKFFGLAGLRLGFAVAAPEIIGNLEVNLGPWAVGGPAIAYGCKALSDKAWCAATSALLQDEVGKLDEVLTDAGLTIVGGTSLYRLVRSDSATSLFDWLCRRGILTRRFDRFPDWLRFGLPPDDDGFARLKIALADWNKKPEVSSR